MELLLSVCLITYNHVKYIAQAIEGVLMQKVNFLFELIIADDFSTDGTREIVEAYQKKYPNLIKLILQKNNVGAAKNWMDLITYPQAKYIAYFEGDDYWTDPLKLQKQVDFLETNSHIFACYHDVIVVDENSNMVRSNYFVPHKEIFKQLDCLVYGAAYSTAALVFRSQVIKNLPAWFIKMPSDYAIDLLITDYGDIAYMAENMGAYRIHQGGIWQGNKSHKNLEATIERFKVCLTNPKFKKEYGPFFYKRISDLSKIIALHYQKENNQFKKMKYIYYHLYYMLPRRSANFNYVIGTMMFPIMYRKLGKVFSRIKY